MRQEKWIFAFEIRTSLSLLFSLISVTAAIGVFCQMGELKSTVRFPSGEEESLLV